MFDSVVQGGDSVWEGLRVYQGKIFKLEEHLDRSVRLYRTFSSFLFFEVLIKMCINRLFDSAKALAFNNVPTREEVRAAHVIILDVIWRDFCFNVLC